MLSDIKKMTKILANFYSISDHKIGAPPGEIKIDNNAFSPLEMKVINYNSKTFTNYVITDVNEATELKQGDIVSWLIVNGFGGNDFLEKLKEDLGFHGLVVEDILNVNHPPRLEFLDDSVFIVLRIITSSNSSLDTSISIVVRGNNLYLFSPVEKFKPGIKLIKRIENQRGVIRKKGIDYLLFALIDLIIDSYFPQIDLIANSIKEIDQNLFENRSTRLLQEIKTIRQVLNVYFDNLYPIKGILAKLVNDDDEFVKEENVKYFNHALKNISYLCERINRLKESTSDIMNLNISMNGQSMNEIMKMLTMMSSIFIPLSFLSGLYGMNFDTTRSPFNMPELGLYYGYPLVLGIMFALITGMIIYFYRKKWF